MSGSHVERPLSAKPISQEYKDNWDEIFGNKNKQKIKKAAEKVLKDPTKSKKAKTARGEALTQSSWGDPTVDME